MSVTATEIAIVSFYLVVLSILENVEKIVEINVSDS